MYRVELKALAQSFTYKVQDWFLMYRVELKG